MKLKVLGSSSAGNCYLLSNDKETLILEAGIPLKKVLPAVNFEINKVKGLLVSHIHGDHSKRIKDYLYLSLDVYAPFTKKENNVSTHPLKDMERVTIGNFEVLPFAVRHDVDTMGFIISHGDIGNLLFVTDTKYLPRTFDGLNHVMIEANYDLDILQKNVLDGKIHHSLAKRIINGHLSIGNAIHAMKQNDLSMVNEIVLIHLSGSNSNPDNFKKRMEHETGVPVFIANKGFETELFYF